MEEQIGGGRLPILENYEMRYCRNFGGGLLGGFLRFATVANRRKPDRVAPLCYFHATREAAKPHLLDLRNFGGGLLGLLGASWRHNGRKNDAQ